MPIEIDTVERRIIQLEIERQALKKESDRPSKERLAKVEKEIADLREQSAGMKAHWQREKEAIGKIRATKEQIEQARFQIDEATRKGDLGKAAELRYGTLPGLEQAAHGRERQAQPAPVAAAHAQGGGRRRGRRRGGGEVDRHPGLAPARGRDAEAAAHRGPAARARRGPGRGAAARRATPCAVRAPASATRTGRSARSSSWVRPASARPSWRGRSRSSCSTTSTPWSVSTCPSTWRSTPWRA